MSPEHMSNNDPRQDNVFAAQRGARKAHFIPAFVRRRPIRAILLAAAVFAIPYALGRHQGDGDGRRPDQAPVTNLLPPIAMEKASGNGVSRAPWNPPVGMDRRNEGLDHLTLDFGTGTSQTPNPPAVFPPDRRVAHSGDTAAESPPVLGPAHAPVTAPADTPATVPDHKMSGHDAMRHDDAARHDGPPIHTAGSRPLDEIDQYLWSVYQRSATKRDSSGDFTWKDEAAAARLGLVTKQYVIGGMDPDFRELLYNLGRAMDEAGLNWTILSGFRDDYRQGLASGYKAHVGNSFHGGSRATGGYGHGCAADIEAGDGEGSTSNAIWKWVDQHGERFGILRPMKVIDPAHIQPVGNWHDIAFNLRDKREAALLAAAGNADGAGITPLVDTRSGVSESQFDCMRGHRHPDFRMAGLHHRGFQMGGRRAWLFHSGRMPHRFGRRRIVVEAAGPSRRSADAAAMIDRHAKAQATGVNRQDARRQKTANVPSPRPRPGKEASLNATQPKRNVKGADAKAHDAKVHDAKAHDVRAPKVADAWRPQKEVSVPASDAKAKSRVAGAGSIRNTAKL